MVDVLRSHAEDHPDVVACRFYARTSEARELTYGELWRRAAAFAQLLRDRALEGERVLLAVSGGIEFVLTFLGCLMAGAVAIPAPPTSRKRLEARLRALLADAQARALVADSDETLSFLREAPCDVFDSRTLWAEETSGAGPGSWRPSALSPSALAFLQYTSGSTGEPKGVMVTHGNIIANCLDISEAMQVDGRSSYLTVLPLFHDMGLVGGLLLPLFHGATANLVPPAQIVQHPELWLQLVSRHRVTFSGGPNFMFDMLTGDLRDEQLQGVDLSSWKVAYCGAEPIRPSTMARFAARFARYGLRPTAFYPCYGMAEATLFVTGGSVGEPGRVNDCGGPALRVGCGRPWGDTRLEIVDPATHRRVEDGAEGEIWIQGRTVAAGYWNRPTLTQDVFRAVLAESGEGPFLRTGDLAVRRGDQLYVTGRLKDVVIVRGKKYAPQDIEQDVEECHPAVQPGGSVAFGVERDGVELLAVVVELRRGWLSRVEEHPAVAEAIRNAIFSAHLLQVSEIALVGTRSIPRTSSGKLQRALTRKHFLEGQLEYVTERDGKSPDTVEGRSTPSDAIRACPGIRAE